MSYLIFPARADADTRNHAEASRRGAGDAPGDETTFWWDAITHPTDGRAALSIPADDVAALSSVEAAQLTPSLSADWFPAASR